MATLVEASIKEATMPGQTPRPLLDLRTFTIIAVAALVGVLTASAENAGAGIVAALGTASALHLIIAADRRKKRDG